MTDLRHDGTTATPGRKSAAGRRPLTSRAQISTIAIDLFTAVSYTHLTLPTTPYV